MRLYLFPISTTTKLGKPVANRTLIYGQRLNVKSTNSPSYLDRATSKAATMWAGWENKDSGWQKKVVVYGNEALKRIPFEEWGLKSIPPLTKQKKEQSVTSNRVELLFPPSLIPEETVLDLLKRIGTERKDLHRKRMIWSVVGWPVVAPFALVPIVPNIPFFYLVYRAWSHWRALRASEHIEFLLENNLVDSKPSKILDELYSSGKNAPSHPPTMQSEGPSSTEDTAGEAMVLHESDGKRIARVLQVPEVESELDRAVWQVGKALSAEKELREEKSELDYTLEKDQVKK